jgi:hypothetical protein
MLLEKYKKHVVVMLSCIVYYTLAGFFILPFILKFFLLTTLPDVLNREVLLQKVKINPYVLSLTFEGLVIKDRNGEILTSFNKTYINIQASSVIKRALVIRELCLIGPYVGIVRGADNTYNFSDLLKNKEQERPKKKKEKKADAGFLPFFIDGITIEDGNVIFHDKIVNEVYTLTDIHLSIPFLSSLPEYTDVDVQPYFAAYL